ncbi:LytR/AlgR family response regulator transcription factor [Pedobacter cryoconitis]|uniref:DNA-binding LytR/AlgR family response regulator n=1 Tax=Pedobacter cryoconitis TaxID=188932 RepID=A0A7X0J4F2_9SPHI|nr:LytTR family DNA-binding domain-containing protein [Pedobacter cryoconitis]MBB6500954.1 DNA-binding LytR/AlgR family response regulator [Pedobacter cryoconitis]
MNCLIVDDDKIFRTIIKQMISLDPSLKLVGECANATEAYKQIMSGQIDLVFLDINLPDITGLDLAKMLKNTKPLLILMTAEHKHAVEAYELNVTDYLVKPVILSRFHEAVEKAKIKFGNRDLVQKTESDEFIFIRDSYIIRRIYLNEILYVEATDNYTSIHLAGRNFSIHSPIKLVEQKLPPTSFFRVHRSFIINLSKIDSIEGKTIMINNKPVPVSDTYRADLNKRIRVL